MRVIIAGLGYTGLAAARVFRARGWEVIGLTHSSDSAAKLAGEFTTLACDISQRDAVRQLAAAGYQDADAVIHCASSGRGGVEQYRAVYLDGSRHLLEELKPRRYLFTSSTSVYIQTDGAWVNEHNEAQPARETGKVLRETENLTLGYNGIVARLAGIYGPGRSVLLRKFFRGEAVIEGDGQRMINQVHRDDIATALATLLPEARPGIYNVCDDEPIPQGDLYRWLAARFTLPVPPEGPMDPNRKRGWTNKRVSNAKLRLLGWTPEWPNFFTAVENDPHLVRLAREQATAQESAEEAASSSSQG